MSERGLKDIFLEAHGFEISLRNDAKERLNGMAQEGRCARR